nr:PREDICTED: uncharacterized protein LOC109036397 [Bemisia tabaci]
MAQFWDIENGFLESDKCGKQECEILYANTTTIGTDGKFIVRLPLREDPTVLGDSKRLALRRLYLLERKLEKNPVLKKMYCDFLTEYEELGHMSEVSDSEAANFPAYYIPHLGVLRQNSLTTKLRVVFNASAKSSSNKSLNDILSVGPSVQDTLFEILLRFREFPVAVVGDITKMYRQTWIHPSQRDLQRILWRKNPKEPVKIYRLNTVTYGTGPASLLATRSLKEAAIRGKPKFPKTANILLKQFYVDDFLGGANDSESARTLKEESEEILEPYGLNLRKRQSSDPAVLTTEMPRTDPFYFDSSEESKALGVGWKPKEDYFFFKSSPEFNKSGAFSKRTILSDISKLFDPLGLVSPIIVKAKFLMQKIWLEQTKNWDQPVSIDILQEWNKIRADLTFLEPITIPRRVYTNHRDCAPIFHGFSDASQKGYGACIYASTSINPQSSTEFQSSLICSKSRVAPSRKAHTIPRLELAAAVLLSDLMCKVNEAVQSKPQKIVLWTDSTTVLHWINNSNSSKWQTFVSNRIKKIQETTTALKAA